MIIKYPYDIKLPVLKCERCSHTWYPIRPQLPKVCPKCKSPYWNKPYIKKGYPKRNFSL